jgi:hypothetical protein
MLPVYVLLLCVVRADIRLFPSGLALDAAEMTFANASVVCTELSNGAFPVVSFVGAELDDLAVFSCGSGLVYATGFYSLPVSASLLDAISSPLTRRLGEVGFADEAGYWTFSNAKGEILEGGYVLPLVDSWLLGGRTGNNQRKQWICGKTE